ncbi:MAG: nitrous oxide reductase family maturation protein NosD [Blastocatellales bacterium]
MTIAISAIAAKAEILIVGPSPARFQTVQSAIAEAKPGDTIQVQPGVYTGQLILDKQLTLEGVGKPVLRGEGRGSVVIVIADRCAIRGFVVEHSGGNLQAEDSGLLLKSNDNVVEDNELRDVLYGVYLYHSARNTIRRNTVRSRPELEVGSRGAGLHLWNSPGNTIEENTISEARDGMYIQTSPGNTVRRNRVFNVRYGLHYMNSDANKFEENIFSDNVAGAAIMYSRKIELRRNAFLHNRGFSSFGILFQDCEENVAEENFIIDNATGVFAEALRKTIFRRNVIAENDLAMQIFSSSAQNLFVENNFIENLSPLRLVGRRSDTRWSEGGRGNYWSDYRGYDLDGDGVGDAPHKVQNVFEYLEGNYPRLRIYLSSPAAQSLAAAEHTFPIIKGSAETDGAPLMRPISLQFHLPLEKSKPALLARSLFAALSLAMAGTAIAVMRSGRMR